jgi:hypothetical protein
MKIAFITDLHVGNHARFGAGPLTRGCNVRCRDILDTIGRAVETARLKGCTDMCVAGDVFDYDRVEPAVEAAMQERITESGLRWAFIVGNHDQTSDVPNHNALAPLKSVAVVHEHPSTVVYAGKIPLTLFTIPFRSGRAEDWLEEAMVEAGVSDGGIDGYRAMMIHLGVSDSETPYYLDGANDSVSIGTLKRLVERYNIHNVFAGNWHCQRLWEVQGQVTRRIIQVGTLAPVRFSDGGLAGYGGMAILDTDNNTVAMVEIPGPRWLTTDLAGLEEALQDLAHPRSPGGARFASCLPLYIAAKVLPDEQELAREIVDELVKRDLIRAGEVTVQAETVRANATAMIRAATQPASRTDMVCKYLDVAPVPPGVDRGEVRDLVLSCLRGVI